MKLNWFSPLPPAKTEIAYHTARLLPVLAEQAQVTLWTDQEKWDRDLEQYAAVNQYSAHAVAWGELNDAQLSVYNIGNNCPFHSAMWQVSQRHPGIVILHDLCLQHLFAAVYAVERQDHAGYIAHMERYYGPGGKKVAEDFFKGMISTEYLASAYPLTQLAIENALAVLVHTTPALESVTRVGRMPVAYCPLPYAPRPQSEDHMARITKVNRAPYRLIMFGHIGANRCLNELLTALAQFPQKDAFRLDVYGQVSDPRCSTDYLKELRLTETVTLHGFVPDAELDAAARAAHLAVNLRNPTMGEASASQLRIWEYALPTLVSQVGWYATLPEDAVAFVRPDHEVADLQTHLAAFLAEPSRFALMGRNGRRHLEVHHRPEAYVQTAIELGKAAQQFRARALAFKLAERIGAELALLPGLHTAEEIYRPIAEQIGSLVLAGPEGRLGSYSVLRGAKVVA